MSLVPYDAVSRAEADGGTLDPPVDGAIVDGEALLVGDAGFGVLIDAPPGSRVYVRPGWQLPIDIRVVPEAGSMRIDVLAPEDAEPNPAYVARVTVVTPSGRAYVAEMGRAASSTSRRRSPQPPRRRPARRRWSSPVTAHRAPP